jgi:hypothetical protein
MIDSPHTHAAEDRRAHVSWAARLAIFFLLAFTMHANVQAAALSAAELDKLTGPIALYPDDLVALILPASTNPLQLVQADRYLEKRKADPKLPLDDKWDDAVKSLLNYPEVVKKMSADLDWTTALGEAVVADQTAVIESVQRFRRQAQSAGNLKSDTKQVVKVEQEVIIIEPADPQVIYVPQYNPATVVVYSPTPVYAYYPAPYPSYYYPYPPGAAMAAGVVWGAALGAAWSGNHYGCCGDTTININSNTNINRNTNINSNTNVSMNKNTSLSGASAKQQGAGSTAWKPSKQPGQVSAGTGRAVPQQTSGAGAGTGRTAAQQTGGGGDAFGSYGSGRQAQMDSSRGASSRSSMSGSRPSASSRSSMSGGASRGGGGRR